MIQSYIKFVRMFATSSKTWRHKHTSSNYLRNYTTNRFQFMSVHLSNISYSFLFSRYFKANLRHVHLFDPRTKKLYFAKAFIYKKQSFHFLTKIGKKLYFSILNKYEKNIFERSSMPTFLFQAKPLLYMARKIYL